MAICRWSSDNYKCDVYVYESCYGGYDVHIASKRYVGDVPKVNMDLLHEKKLDKYRKELKKRDKFFESAAMEDIGLERDGESFSCETEEELYKELKELLEIGYNIPDYVFKILRRGDYGR